MRTGRPYEKHDFVGARPAPVDRLKEQRQDWRAHRASGTAADSEDIYQPPPSKAAPGAPGFGACRLW